MQAGWWAYGDGVEARAQRGRPGISRCPVAAGSPDLWLEQAEVTAGRLNRLADAVGARSYLEIGVETGVTFDRVRVAERTAVDPIFLFDITQHASEDTIFAQTTSDEFFAGLPAAKQYDLIFVDGLHTFEQTYRDLCNCLLHSH